MTNTKKLSEKMTNYLWSESEKAAIKGFDSLFIFCRATKHGFIGNKEKTQATITLEGITKIYYFN